MNIEKKNNNYKNIFFKKLHYIIQNKTLKYYKLKSQVAKNSHKF